MRLSRSPMPSLGFLLLLLLLISATMTAESRLRGPRKNRTGMHKKRKNTKMNEKWALLYETPEALIPAEEDEEATQTRLLQDELGTLEGLGGNPGPEHMPLGLCQGDCDEDSDCGVGLFCFQRDPQMAVPGCIGGEEENSRTDFCIPDPEAQVTSSPAADATVPADPPTMQPLSDEPSANPVGPPTPLPTAVPSYAPTQSPTTEPTEAPVSFAQTLPPAAAPVAMEDISIPTLQPTFATDDPTSTSTSTSTIDTETEIEIETEIELDVVGNNGNPSWAFPLQVCQGDCDTDDECDDGLICFQRDQGEPVPGCIGNDSSRNDYCILDPDRAPTPFPTTSYPTSTPTLSAIPTIAPTTIKPTESSHPSTRPTISSPPTELPSDFPSDVPSDSPSLVPTESPMPTVSAEPTSAPTSSPTTYTRTGVQLKLYWEEGYLWQDETIERKWCMISDYHGFPGTGKCWHGLKTEPCHSDMVYVARCDSDTRQRFSIYPMPGGTQYQIGIYQKNACLERLEYSLVLRECDYLNPLQRFWIPRGALFQKRFELSPITLANHCVTQSHHPKSGEVVELHKCSRARSDEHQSSFWNVH